MYSETRGLLAAGPALQVPYPALPEHVLRVVVNAVELAWERVRNDPAAQADPRREVSITLALERQLNRMLNDPAISVPGFTASIFETVIRGGEIENSDSSSLERRPDLTFRLAGESPIGTAREHYGLFAECKLLDATHSLKAYCDTGLRRFIDCQYAWAMPHAMMLAYAEQPPTPADLVTLLTTTSNYATVGQPAISTPPPAVGVRSMHTRSKVASVGPVDITHVWLLLHYNAGAD